jgi:regulator of RNase E activity RraB
MKFSLSPEICKGEEEEEEEEGDPLSIMCVSAISECQLPQPFFSRSLPQLREVAVLQI